ncbi:Zinc finger RING/FYVE/PHD-type protein [Dioscorea alata]|uniref:Zinc finger RING/FYVE/PHD-type protein n=1 Tax=Dioscorea alata TaxID=55571 RepID=A0ACB7U431_DIOAL|nr:Zinc finger RING/FYVE/PHD-type protein [Dioscorea alata]
MDLQGSDTPSADEGAAGTTCSICLEVVDMATRTRSMAKLRCGHEFHLDCICSAFNYSGKRQCPNCADIEEGYWQFTNRRGTRQNTSQPANRTAEARRRRNGIPWCSSCLFHHNGPCSQAVLPIMMSPVYANEVHISWEEPAPHSITILLMNGADQCLPSIYDSRTYGQFVSPNLRYPANYQFRTNGQRHHPNHNSGGLRGHVSSALQGMPVCQRWWWFP